MLSLLVSFAACSEDTTRPHEDAGQRGDGDSGDGDSGDGDAGDGDSGDGDAGDGDSQGGSKTDAELLAEVSARLKECKVWQPFHERVVIEDDFDRCGARCTIDASCALLYDLTCSDDFDSVTPYFECIEDCPFSPKDGFACKGGRKIPHVAVCDGEEDCSDGADEQGCEPFVCKDGEEIMPADIDCDGFEDCSDGSDEEGCVNVCE